MGDLIAGVRAHRRVIAVGAVVLLPLSTAAATATVATPSRALVGVPPSGNPVTGNSLTARPVKASTPDVSKIVPAAWTTVGGHTAVVVGTVKQRIAQASATTSHDIPLAALDAYKSAERSVAASSPGCHLSWTLLAAIGQVESDNGRYGGAVVLANGDTSPHILGPVLNGVGAVGAIGDTDAGRYDGDPVWDRAVGPMQFIPGTWAGYGADGNGDGVSDPNNIADAALAAARYLCAGGGDLRVESQLRAAVMRYNYSVAYVDLVLRLAQAYASGAATVVPNGHATTPAAPPAVRPNRDHEAAALPAKRPPRGQHARRAHGSGRHGGSGGGQGGGGQGGQGGGGGGGSQPPTTSLPTPPTKPTPPTTTTPTRPTPPTTTSPIKPTPPITKPDSPVTQPEPIATGVLRTCKSGWCVGATVLDFGETADLRTPQGDLNADGKTRSLLRELRALEGLTMTVTVVVPAEPVTPDKGTVSIAPSEPTSPSTDLAQAPATPATTEGKREDPAPIEITVDADGLVTSINAVAYSPPAPNPIP